MNSDRKPFRVLFVCMGNICRSPAAEMVCSAPGAVKDTCFAETTMTLTGFGVDDETSLAASVDPTASVVRTAAVGHVMLTMGDASSALLCPISTPVTLPVAAL